MAGTRRPAAKGLNQWVQELEQYYLDEFGEDVEADESKKVLTFREFVNKVFPRYQWYKHCEVLGDALQRVADGELKRLMVFMPPRAGKSQIASKLFPAYYLYRHPEKFVGIASYGMELANTLSRSCRDAYLSIGMTLKDDAASVKHWETGLGGGLWAAGVGSAATGKGYSLGLIDDPVRNSEDAASVTIQEKHKEWYESVFYTRGEPDSSLVIIQTRWNENDLSGWLLQQESSDHPERWHIVNFEALKEDKPPKFPPTCTVEPDWRNPGESLCPERFDVSKLLKIKSQIGSRFFEALYQQNPSPAEGGLFKRHWWKYYKVYPARFDQIIQSWDCTFKDSANSDYVVGQVWGKVGGEYYLLDQVRDRMDINGTLAAVLSLSARYPEARAKLVESKANGQAVIDLLKRKVSGLIPVEPEGGKVVRANAAAPYVEAGNVYLPDPLIAPWIHDFVEELASFPNGAHDDAVDSFSMAINYLEKNSHQDYVPMSATILNSRNR